MAAGVYRWSAPYSMVILMKKWIIILCCLLPMLSCVGQKDDPEPVPIDNPDNPFPDPWAGEGDEYFRRSLVLDFTGTWCVHCPKMQAAVAQAQQLRPGRIVSVGVHCLDAMSLEPWSSSLVSRFGVTAYPSAVVDLERSSLITTSSPDLLLSHCDRLLKVRGKAAGLKIQSTLEDAVLNVEVEATAVRNGEYNLALLVLEDGIVAPQTGASGDYVHNDVLRFWEESPVVFRGGGEVFEASFSLAAGSGKLRCVALVCRGGIVDNVTVCKAGESIGYLFEK